MKSDFANAKGQASTLPPQLVERVLAGFGLVRKPEPTLESLRAIYGAWCQRVPFDNVRKIIHVSSANPAPLPGSQAEDFFDAWLKYGTGGTCWSGAGALHALLTAMGFSTARGVATMLAAPNLPPNHGTVVVDFGASRYLVDSSMLHAEPLRLEEAAETNIAHPAWGLRCAQRDGRWHIAWRPLHKLDGFECRLERFGASAAEYHNFYDQTRGWSPFNYEVVARTNRGDNVVGMAFGHAVTLHGDERVSRVPVSGAERARVLIEAVGLSEEIVGQLPQDTPTPPPPWSQTAQAQAQPPARPASS